MGKGAYLDNDADTVYQCLPQLNSKLVKMKLLHR